MIWSRHYLVGSVSFLFHPFGDPFSGRAFLKSLILTSRTRPTSLYITTGTATPSKTCDQSNPAWVLPVCPCPCERTNPVRLFLSWGRSGPRQQWCTAGRIKESQDPVWGPVLRKRVVLRTHCAELHGDKGRKEVMWSICPASPLLYHEIRSHLSHCNASSRMQLSIYSNTAHLLSKVTLSYFLLLHQNNSDVSDIVLFYCSE